MIAVIVPHCQIFLITTLKGNEIVCMCFEWGSMDSYHYIHASDAVNLYACSLCMITLYMPLFKATE